MNEPRYDCQVVSFDDSIIYAVGGRDSSTGRSRLASMEKLEMDHNEGQQPLGEWTRMPEMDHKRCGFGVAVVKTTQRIVAVGGSDKTSFHASAEIFHTESNRWERLPDMTTKRYGCAATAVNDRVFVLGGFDGSKKLRSGEYYSFATNEWTPLPPMSRERTYPAVVAVGKFIVVIGGQGKRYESLADVEVLDTETMEWQTNHNIPSLYTARFTHGAAFLDGALYVLGGGNHNYPNTMEMIVLDPYKYRLSKLKPVFHASPPIGLWAHIISACPSNVINYIIGSDKAALDGILLHRNERKETKKRRRENQGCMGIK